MKKDPELAGKTCEHTKWVSTGRWGFTTKCVNPAKGKTKDGKLACGVHLRCELVRARSVEKYESVQSASHSRCQSAQRLCDIVKEYARVRGLDTSRPVASVEYIDFKRGFSGDVVVRADVLAHLLNVKEDT